MSRTIIILNFNTGEVDIHTKVLADMQSAETYIQEQGYSLDEIEWMVVDDLKVNIK